MYIPFCNRNERMLQIQEEWHEYFSFGCGTKFEMFTFKVRAWIAYNL